MASLVSVFQLATLFVLVFAVYSANGLKADDLRRYSYEDDSIEYDDWIYMKPGTATSNFKPKPPFRPSYDGISAIIVGEGQRPSKIPVVIGTAPSSTVADPSKPLPPSPVPIYLVPSSDNLPLYKPPYTLGPSGEAVIVFDGQRPSKIPIVIGTAPSPVVEDPSKPLTSPVPIYLVPSTDDLPPYNPPYTGGPSGETVIVVDGQAPSENPISIGTPPLTPVEDPSKPLPSPVPIYLVQSSDILPPYKPPYTAETVTATEGQKPSENLVTIETPPVPIVEGPTKPLPSPVPIDLNPSVCGRKNNCYQWFDDKLQLSLGGYELCDAKDEIRARWYCCIR